MSESWINRLWQLVLVCTFAIVLSVCNKALDETTESGTGSAVGTAFADGPVTISAMPKVEVESTATVSSMPVIKLDNGTSFAITSLPSLKADITSMPSQTVEILAAPKLVVDNSSSLAVSSLPSVNVASQALPSISAIMYCINMWNETRFNEGKLFYHNCDSSNDDSSIAYAMNVANSGGSNDSIYYAISHDDAFKNGWKLLRTGGINAFGFVFYK
jgi:hypothetical protein